MKKKNILFISYYYPPIKAIGSLRTYFLSKELNKLEWNVYIFTTTNKDIFNKDNMDLSFCKNIQYIFTFDFQKLKVFVKNFKKFQKISKYKKQSATVQKSNNIFKILNSFPINISYEGGFIYSILSIYRGQKFIKKYDIDYIYSTYSPYSNHLVAYFLKILNPKLIWIADFRDLPPGISEEVMFGRSIQNKINKNIFIKANALITVSNGLKTNLTSLNDNIKVIHNGFEKMKPNVIKEDESIIKITYTGNLYGGKRNIEVLLKAIKILINNYKEKIQFVYAGKDGELVKNLFIKYGLEQCLINKGIITRNEALKLQSETTINLMVTWASKKEKGILTGKFFEYLESNKPILCVINGEEDDELETIFKKTNVGKVVYGTDENEIVTFLKDNKSYKYNQNEVNKFSYAYLGKKLETLFIDISMGNRD